MLKLTTNQKIVLETGLKKVRKAFERNRLCVILGRDEGLSIEDAA